jgi:hypothetical protein
MNKKSINGSLMALVLATSALGTAAPQTNIIGLNQVKLNSIKDSSTLYKLAFPARYKDTEKGYVDGQIYLRLYKSKLTPRDLSNITAEFEGYFYFESNENISNENKLHLSLGGEDDNVILDMVNRPPHSATELPKVYNMHGCNSTMTSCDPMLMQMNVFRDGTINLNGALGENVEVSINGTWTKEINSAILNIQEEN